MEKQRKNVPLIYTLCGEPAPHTLSVVWRAIGSILFAVPAAWLMMSIADNANVSRPIADLISPGTAIGLLSTAHVHGLARSLHEFGAIALSTDLIYWSLILFGFSPSLSKLRKPDQNTVRRLHRGKNRMKPRTFKS